ncbi:phage tail protein [Escherichia coli]|nr:phage tail protein [Escherichia coli]
MIYTTGTISVNGNTATGANTNWTDPVAQVRAGQTLIILSSPVQIFQITAVNSATQLTVTPAASPSVSGQKYAILVSDVISVDGLSQAMSQLIKEYDENIDAWETFATTSANQGITVTINGTAITIPSIGKLVQKGSNGALPLDQGGTGATTKEDARKNLGLGSSATKNTGTTSNDVMQPGMFGLGRPDGVTRLASTSIDGILAGFSSFGFSILRNDAQIPEPWYVHNYSPAMWMRAGDTYTLWCAPFENSGFIRVFGGADGRGWLTGRRIWDDVTTSVDVNGFIKKASPVIKLRGDGTCEVNDEADGCTVIRQGAGVYLIDGCMGLHSDAAWGGPDGGFEIPVDRNKLAPIWLDYTVNADGSILVKTYHRTHPDAPEFARNLIGEKDSDGNIIETVKNGEPIDIPAGLFVSVRVEMPENSIFNQKLKETEDAVLAAKQENDDNNEPNQ